MHLIAKKKHKFQVILHFFHKISENLLQKKKQALCNTSFLILKSNIITLDFLGGLPTSFPCPRTTQPCHDLAIPQPQKNLKIFCLYTMASYKFGRCLEPWEGRLYKVPTSSLFKSNAFFQGILKKKKEKKPRALRSLGKFSFSNFWCYFSSVSEHIIINNNITCINEFNAKHFKKLKFPF